MRFSSPLILIVAAIGIAISLCGCPGDRDDATAVVPTPPSAIQQKAAADSAAVAITVKADEKPGLLLTPADYDKQIQLLTAKITANTSEMEQLRVDNNLKLGEIKDLKKDKQAAIEATDAAESRLLAVIVGLIAVAFGVLWFFAPAPFKDLDAKAATVCGGSAAVLYAFAAWIGYFKWLGLAIALGFLGYRLYKGHVIQAAFAKLVQEGHVVIAGVSRAGWVQAVVDDFHALAVRLHLTHAAAPTVIAQPPKV